jgi:hypothetical protein
MIPSSIAYPLLVAVAAAMVLRRMGMVRIVNVI